MRDHPHEVVSLLQGPAAAMGVSLSDSALAGLSAYTEELQLWAPRQNLVSDSSTAAIAERHILDSLAGVGPLKERLGEDLRIVDLGSGAGLPGIPLGLASSARATILVEPRQRRAHFLRAVARRLPESGISILCSRAEDLGATEPALAGTVDVVVSRATFADPATFLRHASLLLRAGGLAMRWCREADESDPVAHAVGLTPLPQQAYSLPGTKRTLALALHVKSG